MEFVINLRDLVSPVVRQTTTNVKSFRAATQSAGRELLKLGGSSVSAIAKSLVMPFTDAGKRIGVLSQSIAKNMAKLGSLKATPNADPEQIAALTKRIEGAQKKVAALGGDPLADLGEQAATSQKAIAAFAKSGVLLAASAVTTLAKVSLGAAVGVAAFGIKTALMFRGMGAYAGQVERFNFNVKRLFRGVDVTPVIRATQRLADFFDVTRDSGREMSSILTRGVNLAARAIEAVIPIGEEFVWGLIAGFYMAEATAYRVATAVLRLAGPSIKWARQFTDGIDLASIAGKLGIGVFLGITAVLVSMAVATALTVIPLVALGVAFVYVGGKVYGLLDALGLAKPLLYGVGVAALLVAAPALVTAAAVAALAYGLGWLVDKITAAVNAFKAWAGISGQVQTATTGIGDSVAGLASKLPGGEKANETGKALSAGVGPSLLAAVLPANENGRAVGAGFAQGLLASLPGVDAASAQLVAAVDQSVRTSAQIRSPAKRFVAPGRFIGLGVAEGIEQSGPAVQQAAEETLVPSVPSPFGGGAPPAGPAPTVQTSAASAASTFHVENVHVYVNGRETEGEMKRLHEAWLTDVAVQMGLTAA